MLAGSSDRFFTNSLNLDAAAELIQTSDTVFRTAIAKDTESSGKPTMVYLQEVMDKATQYMENDEICGRGAITADIKQCMLQKGTLAFVTGGRSVGKSKILNSIVNSIDEDQGIMKPRLPQARVAVFMVDGRKTTDLAKAMSDLATGDIVAATNKLVKGIPVSSITFPYGVSIGFDLSSMDFAVRGVTQAVDTLANKRSRNTDHSVLILDEANAFLRCAGDKAAMERAKELFDAVVWNTKQNNRMSVLMVSSDEGLPYHLADLNMNPHHISKTLVISEPSPRECLDLLQEKFGIGEHLSHALLDCYGGNLHQICLLLKALPSAYEREEYEINVFMGPASDVSNALAVWLADTGDLTEIVAVLEELARTGFVPVSNFNSKLARLLTKLNICAYLTRDAVEHQVPKKLRAKRAGLIPSSQLLRVLIANELVQIKVCETGRCGISCTF